MRLHTDRTKCQGHARCNAHAPSVFELNDDGYIALAESILIPAEEEDAVRLGVDDCPESVFTIEEAGGPGA